MKIFEYRKMRLFKKIIMCIVILITINFSCFGEVKASDSVKGGKLLNPIGDLLCFAGDGIMNIVHKILYDQSDTTISVDRAGSFVRGFIVVAVFAVVAAVAAVAIVATAGAVTAALATLGVSISAIGAGTVILASVGTGFAAAVVFNSQLLPDVLEIPVYQISPDKIFSNEILLLDVDFFNPKERAAVLDVNGNEITDENGQVVYRESTAEQIRKTISNWYIVLRDIAIVALLSILVYIGIRIIISSTSNDKAKYKQMLVDWIVAICLLFLIQYIMSFANLLVGKITEVVSSTANSNGYTTFIADDDDKVKDALEELGYEGLFTQETIDNKKYVIWPTNSLGYARLEAQMAKKENTTYAGYALIFAVLVLFTVYFIITYLKRVLYMAFLTLIAPLVAMTYPIDKLNDGKAQAFDMWFKEYIFNLLIQPMHLILYTVLVTSAYSLSSTNIIYSLVALGFMIPAEKLLRKFFGFEKAQTPGLLAGPAGAALMMNGVNRLIGKGPKGQHKHSSGNGGKSESADDGKPPRIDSNFDKDEEIFGDKNSRILDDGLLRTNTKGDGPVKSDNEENNNTRTNNTEIDDNTRFLYDDFNNTGTMPKINNNQYENGYSLYNKSEKTDNKVNPEKGSTYTNIQGSRKTRRNKIKNAVGRVKNNGSKIGSFTRYYGRGVLRQAKNGMKNVHPLKSATRFAAGAVGAAAVGAAGLAIGITSGDLSKAGQYTAAAAMGGYRLSTGVKDKMDSSLTPEGANDMSKRIAFENDDEYKKMQQQKYIKNYQKNEKNRFELERRYGKEKADEIMDKEVPTFLNNGITDMDDITTVLEMRDMKQIKDIKEGIAVKKYASRIGENSTKMTKKKRDEWKETFSLDFRKKGKYKEMNHDVMADTVLKKIDQFNKIRFK